MISLRILKDAMLATVRARHRERVEAEREEAGRQRRRESQVALIRQLEEERDLRTEESYRTKPVRQKEAEKKRIAEAAKVEARQKEKIALLQERERNEMARLMEDELRLAEIRRIEREAEAAKISALVEERDRRVAQSHLMKPVMQKETEESRLAEMAALIMRRQAKLS